MAEPSASAVAGTDTGVQVLEMRGWKFKSVERGACDEAQRHEVAATLRIDHVPLPELVFARSSLTIQHSASGLTLRFVGVDALMPWAARQSQGGASPRHFDFTFRTEYVGTLHVEEPGAEAAARKPAEMRETASVIPLELLKRRERIHLYCCVTLFEDELNDSGVSQLSVKLRVMPSYFLVLLRHFVRVDGQMVRRRDTRYFHEFGADEVLGDVEEREASIPELQRLGRIQRPFSASASGRAQGSEPFVAQPENAYELLSPRVRQQFCIALGAPTHAAAADVR